MSNSYALSTAPPWLLHDWESESNQRRYELMMQIRSGDYFTTLATHLDELSQELGLLDETTAIAFERIISELLYLQRYYYISEKPRIDSGDQLIG